MRAVRVTALRLGLVKASYAEELLPGDIIVREMGPRRTWSRFRDQVGQQIYRMGVPLTQGSAGHASLYVGGGEVIDADDEGVRLLPVDRMLKGKKYVVRRLPDPDTAARAAELAKEHLGREYGDARMFAAGIGALLPVAAAKVVDKAVRESDPICSSLVAEAYERAGRPLTQVPSGVASPADLAFSDELGTVGGTGELRRALVGRHASPAGNVAATAASLGLVAGTVALTRGRRR